jgi:hypothetical protein
MIIIAQQAYQKFQRVFTQSTRILIQVKTGAGTVTIAKDQGEIANAPADGLSFTAASTTDPWADWWQGELWYVSDTPNQPFVLEILTL